MADSLSLVTAQISILEPQLVLVDISTELYNLFLQPILQLLFADDHDQESATRPWTSRHDFLNVSITPESVSIICTRFLADKYFVPVQQRWKAVAGDGFEIVDETYIVIQVDGQGLDPGQRVLELTSPLAMAGISIFFLTTYFSDFILVPTYARRTVTTALEQRGFVFSRSADAFISQLSPAASPFLGHRHHQRNSSAADWILSPTSSTGFDISATPPAKDLPELQRRTFDKMRKHSIGPLVDREMRLLICAGSDDDLSGKEQLKSDLLQVLISTSASTMVRKSAEAPTNSVTNGHHHHRNSMSEPPNDSNSTSFLSITVTANDPISIFMEARLLDRLGGTLLGNKSLNPEDVLVPITFDLHTLPMKATGVVCGVAGCLAAGETSHRGKDLGSSRGGGDDDSKLDITFLSTAKAGIVLVKECDLDRALAALSFGMKRDELCSEDFELWCGGSEGASFEALFVERTSSD